MNKIQAKLDGMLKETDSLCLTELVKGRHLNKNVSKLQTSSFIDESHVLFGREDDKKQIVDMLLSSNDSSKVSVLPIVGIIGVGKTTLAQLVYNHEFDPPFGLKMWVSVTNDFNVVKLTRSIIEAATRESTSHLLNLESLQAKLMEVVLQKKFLLVLDDLWAENWNEWKLLLIPLSHGCKGSKIIITTGSLMVSSIVGTTRPYQLKCLSDKDCWSLLKDEASADIDLEKNPKLEAIGMKIARKCKGLPLAAKIVGSLLHFKVNEHEWNSILESRIWDLSEIRHGINSALKSGYYRLPSHVRQCFAYCSMFPHNYNFEKNKIVQMWMGEGFIMSEKERRKIEDIGASYLDQLLLKSFFQMEGGKYKIHDAVHDLAQSVSSEKFIRIDDINDSRINRSTRHLSLVCEKIERTTYESFYMSKGLRTFLILREYGNPIKEVPLAFFMELSRLRVLDLSSTRIEQLFGSIGNLKHLRFLDLSNTLLKWLPETIGELSILQTLRLINCSKLLCLPESTCKLRRLQHLELGADGHLISMPSGIGQLTGLQTLSEFVVGSQSGGLKELKDMNNIQGLLDIKRMERVRNPREALEANLAKKKYLQKLVVQWTHVADARNDEHVLDKLSPHESLKELTLKRYGGRMFPKWVSNPMFSKLTTILFYDCKNIGLLPSLGELPSLMSIKIVGMDELRRVDEVFHGNAGFQQLETLEFCNMPMLESWGGLTDGGMARLRELSIINCPQIVTIPSLHYFQSMVKVEFEDCPQLPLLSKGRLSTSMQTLIITECPVLEFRCRRGGDDWRKIDHIPYVEIDFVSIRLNE